MVSKKKLALFTVNFLTLVLLLACSARIDGTLKQGGAADLILKTSLEPRMTSLIKSFQSMMGSSGSADLILDGQAIGKSMASAPGIASVSLKNTAPSAIEGTVGVSKAGDFLAVGEKKFVTYTDNTDTSANSANVKPSGRLVIALDLQTAPDVLALLSPDAVDYLNALMAPAATGESISRREYLNLVTTLYGKPIADEIQNAKIRASLNLPGPIAFIHGGTAVGSRADFEVPLLDLLVLDTPLFYEVSW
ncbi:hypothetical protein [Leadbettera azotonutricia]|uniref:Putative lipoprotein n=1 Tax=Leadbettera azotonutricia (strain ATCC BAA-888 / DSM 13862 / ZAS-9) TaxID=545695 RepID=F5Y980_LEAAZ|nr:hypothetical protein [Leadbettera azotonutricia]AEF81239.1 putative lipoprotein [Leadbettera azotonutricia ZAS-9]